MSEVEPRPMAWRVNGLQLAGLAWGDPAAPPLLALHGWLDNAASFSVLAPLLAGFHVVALDLSGHGRSDHRSADAGYQIWDDLPEIAGVADAQGWDKFCLIGHSRGAIISSLLAASLPERVERLVLLDAVAPQALAEDQFAVQMGKFIKEKKHWQGRQNRVYESLEAAVDSRSTANLTIPAARLLVERNLRPCPGGFTWTTDLRLRGASAVKLSAGHIRAVLAALSMPTLLMLARDGFSRHPQIAEQARKYIRQLQLEEVAGGHHFHMEASTGIVANRINSFLQA